MNYIIENNIDFYKELNTNNSIDDLSNICLLTHQPLEQNYIKLECNHTFNYIPIYKEICRQKYSKNNYLETCYLSINEIKCPYCRNINSKLLPLAPGFSVPAPSSTPPTTLKFIYFTIIVLSL